MKLKAFADPDCITDENPLGLAVADAETGERLRDVLAIRYKVQVDHFPVIEVEFLDYSATGGPLKVRRFVDSAEGGIPVLR